METGTDEAEQIVSQSIELPFEKLKEIDGKLARIEARCAQYREFQADDDCVDADRAFSFGDYAANVCLPWCVKLIQQAEREASKQSLALYRANEALRRLRKQK